MMTRYCPIRTALLALIIGYVTLGEATRTAVAQQPTSPDASTDASAELPTLDAAQGLLEAGRIEAALIALNQRIDANSGDAAAHFLKALALQQRGDRAGARDVYLGMAKQFPKLPEVSNNLAALYVADSDYEKARETLLAASVRVPDYPLLQVNLGDLYLRMAADAYRKAVEMDPADDETVAALGRLQQMLGAVK